MTRWTGKGDATHWTDPANWTAGVPASGVDALFTAGKTETVRLAGKATPLTAGTLLVQGDSLTLTAGVLNLAPMPAQSGNTFDLVLSQNAEVTIAAGTTLQGSNVAEIGDGSGASLTVQGTVAEEYGVLQSGTLDVAGPHGHWLSGDSGLYVDSSNLTVQSGAHIDTGGKLAQYPAAALDIEGNSTALVTGAGSTIRLSNTFVSEFSGTSTLTIQDGGHVFSGGGTIGNTGDGTLIVDGAGSLFHASRGINIGGQVPVNSKLLIENGGSVDIGAYGIGLYGTLAIDGVSSLTTPFILSGGGVIQALSGTVTIEARLSLYSNYTDPFETQTTYLEAAPGATLLLSGAISTADPGATTQILDAASGHIVLAHADPKFAGTTAIYGATLEIAAAGAAGTGPLTFFGGTHPATLQIDADHPFNNVITDFAAADTIDLAGFTYGTTKPTLSWTPNASGGTLTLTNDAHTHQSLIFAGTSLSATSFTLNLDALGGTAITHS